MEDLLPSLYAVPNHITGKAEFFLYEHSAIEAAHEMNREFGFRYSEVLIFKASGATEVRED